MCTVCFQLPTGGEVSASVPVSTTPLPLSQVSPDTFQHPSQHRQIPTQSKVQSVQTVPENPVLSARVAENILSEEPAGSGRREELATYPSQRPPSYTGPRIPQAYTPSASGQVPAREQPTAESPKQVYPGDIYPVDLSSDEVYPGGTPPGNLLPERYTDSTQSGKRSFPPQTVSDPSYPKDSRPLPTPHNQPQPLQDGSYPSPSNIGVLDAPRSSNFPSAASDTDSFPQSHPPSQDAPPRSEFSPESNPHSINAYPDSQPSSSKFAVSPDSRGAHGISKTTNDDNHSSPAVQAGGDSDIRPISDTDPSSSSSQGGDPPGVFNIPDKVSPGQDYPTTPSSAIANEPYNNNLPPEAFQNPFKNPNSPFSQRTDQLESNPAFVGTFLFSESFLDSPQGVGATKQRSPNTVDADSYKIFPGFQQFERSGAVDTFGAISNNNQQSPFNIFAQQNLKPLGGAVLQGGVGIGGSNPNDAFNLFRGAGRNTPGGGGAFLPSFRPRPGTGSYNYASSRQPGIAYTPVTRNSDANAVTNPPDFPRNIGGSSRPFGSQPASGFQGGRQPVSGGDATKVFPQSRAPFNTETDEMDRFPMHPASNSDPGADGSAGFLPTSQQDGSSGINGFPASSSSDSRVDDYVGSSNSRVDGSVGSSNSRVDGSVGSSNSRVDDSVDSSNSRVDGSVGSSNSRVDGSVGSSNSRVDGFPSGSQENESSEINNVPVAGSSNSRVNVFPSASQQSQGGSSGINGFPASGNSDSRVDGLTGGSNSWVNVFPSSSQQGGSSGINDVPASGSSNSWVDGIPSASQESGSSGINDVPVAGSRDSRVNVFPSASQQGGSSGINDVPVAGGSNSRVDGFPSASQQGGSSGINDVPVAGSSNSRVDVFPSGSQESESSGINNVPVAGSSNSRVNVFPSGSQQSQGGSSGINGFPASGNINSRVDGSTGGSNSRVNVFPSASQQGQGGSSGINGFPASGNINSRVDGSTGGSNSRVNVFPSASQQGGSSGINDVPVAGNRDSRVDGFPSSSQGSGSSGINRGGRSRSSGFQSSPGGDASPSSGSGRDGFSGFESPRNAKEGGFEFTDSFGNFNNKGFNDKKFDDTLFSDDLFNNRDSTTPEPNLSPP